MLWVCGEVKMRYTWTQNRSLGPPCKVQCILNGQTVSQGLLPSTTQLRKGNVFTSVCQKFCPQGTRQTPPPDRTDTLLDQADTPWNRQTLPGPGRHPHPPEQADPRPQNKQSPTPSGEVATAADSYWNAFFLLPANEVWGSVIFLHLSVILFTAGVCLSACWDTHPPGSRHPWSRHPPPRSRHPPWEQTPLEQTPSPRSRHPPMGADPPAQCMLGDTVNKRAVCILLECNLVNTVINTVINVIYNFH